MESLNCESGEVDDELCNSPCSGNNGCPGLAAAEALAIGQQVVCEKLDLEQVHWNQQALENGQPMPFVTCWAAMSMAKRRSEKTEVVLDTGAGFPGGTLRFTCGAAATTGGLPLTVR